MPSELTCAAPQQQCGFKGLSGHPHAWPTNHLTNLHVFHVCGRLVGDMLAQTGLTDHEPGPSLWRILFREPVCVHPSSTYMPSFFKKNSSIGFQQVVALLHVVFVLKGGEGGGETSSETSTWQVEADLVVFVMSQLFPRYGCLKRGQLLLKASKTATLCRLCSAAPCNQLLGATSRRLKWGKEFMG